MAKSRRSKRTIRQIFAKARKAKEPKTAKSKRIASSSSWKKENPKKKQKESLIPEELKLVFRHAKNIKKIVGKQAIRAIKSELSGLKSAAATTAKYAKETLIGRLGAVLETKTGKSIAQAITRAKEALTGVTKRIISAVTGGRIFGKPVEEKPAPSRPGVPKERARFMLEHVSSSNVDTVAFESSEDNANVGTLFISFLSGWEYRYNNAPIRLYKGLIATPSPGGYVWAKIRRDLYPDTAPPYGRGGPHGYLRLR